MTKKTVPIPEHRDKLNRILSVGNHVAYPAYNSLAIGVITKLNNKMIKVKELNTKNKWSSGEKNKYSCDTVIIEGKDVTMYILRNSA